MGARPNRLCNLETGKLIDSHKGFVDTFNWLKDYINNLRGDDNMIEVDTSASDHPIIKFIGKDQQGSQPEENTIDIYGTDGNKAICKGVMKFIAGNDSNVKIIATNNDDGEVELKVDVFYI